MKKLFFFLLAFACYSHAKSQATYKIQLDNKDSIYKRSQNNEAVIRIFLKGSPGSLISDSANRLSITINQQETNLAPSEYSISLYDVPAYKFDSVDYKNNVIYLVLNKNEAADAARKIVLQLQLKRRDMLQPASLNTDNAGKLVINIAAQEAVAKKPVNTQLSLAFVDTTYNVIRSKDKDETFHIVVRGNAANFKDYPGYTLSVSADKDSSTLPVSKYIIDNGDIPLSEFTATADKRVHVIIKRDTLDDNKQTLVLKMDVKKDGVIQKGFTNNGTLQRLTLKIKEHKINEKLEQYNYLAYVGTNFDLVDGVKTRNLFFATNIFLPPTEKKTVGFYVSLYGNRTMTGTDSMSAERTAFKAVRGQGDTLITYYRNLSAVRTIVSDNLGAYSSPIIRLGNTSNISNQLRLYFTPSLEFIWRRTSVNYLYSGNGPVDSIKSPNTPGDPFEKPNTANLNFSEYSFNAGGGVMVVHENKNISVRLHATMGYNITYLPYTALFLTKGEDSNNQSQDPTHKTYAHVEDIFFTGRLWITEPKTGLTLQAEVTNTSKYPRPFYGVTLSKALDFRDIGNIFKPITSR